MDPLEAFPAEICEYIFQHLTARELLFKASLVSKLWHSFVGTSSSLMRKAKLTFNRVKDSQPLSKKVFERSIRKYQHLEIVRSNAAFVKDVGLLFSSHMRTLKLRQVVFSNTQEIANFLSAFEATVEDIHLDSLYIESIEFHQMRGVKPFKCLKRLYVNCDQDCSNVFVKCRNLIEYRVIASAFALKHIRPISKLLQRNEQLKTLEISLPIYDSIIINSAIEPTFWFKLHTLEISNRSHSPQEHLDDFLKLQSESLCKLTFRYSRSAKTLEIAFRMPRLRELDLGNVECVRFENLRLQVSKSIEKLTFIDISCDSGTMRTLVSAAPNVRELKIHSMTQHTMTLVTTFLKSLESLTMRTIDVEELSDASIFPKLRSCSVDIVASDLEDHMEALPVESRSTIVRLILASNYVILH